MDVPVDLHGDPHQVWTRRLGSKYCPLMEAMEVISLQKRNHVIIPVVAVLVLQARRLLPAVAAGHAVVGPAPRGRRQLLPGL